MPEQLPSSDFLQPSTLADEIGHIEDIDSIVEHTSLIAEFEAEENAPTRRKYGAAFWIAAGWLALVTILALLAPVLPLRDPEIGVKVDRETGDVCPENTPDPNCKLLSLEAPFVNPEVPLGTNKLGRDMLSQVIWGARTSLMVGFASILFGIVIGGTVGLTAGYVKGRTETGLMGFMDIMLAFPPLILALAIVTFRDDNSVSTVVLALGIVAIPSIARLVRANTIVYTEREFVLAARTLGAKNPRIVVREVLPNVIPAVISFSILGVAVAIVAEGLLAFLGLSVDVVTWGQMINDGRDDFTDYPYLVVIPCMALWLTVMTLNLMSDQLRKLFDVKESAL
jgi:peptide/nickel transport system permease protein